MNKKFFELAEEKRNRIIKAAIEVFSKNDYKHASTDDIAVKAGISKGLLFYYFHNKKELYLYIYDFVGEYLKSNIMDFVIRAFFSQNEEISDKMNQIIKRDIADIYERYFRKIDYGKFKEGVDVQKILQMLIWMTEGYLHGEQLAKEPVTIDEMMKEFSIWLDMFKRLVYKEEFI